jgi:hypothetical protein
MGHGPEISVRADRVLPCFVQAIVINKSKWF